MRRHAPTFALLQLVAVVGAFGFTHLVLMPVMASVWGGGPAENGYLLGAVGLGATLGGLAVATRTPTRRPDRHTVILAYAAGIGMVVFALSRYLPLSLMFGAWIG